MQVTGSNSENDKKILSVRLRQGGLSFYLADDEGTMQYGIDFRKEASPAGQIARMTARLRSDFDLVQVFADTDRTLFVPADLLAEADPKELLRRAGIVPDPTRTVVVAEAVEEVSAVMVVETAAIEALRLLPVRRMRFYSPLQELLAAWRREPVAGGGWMVYPTGDNFYVTRYGADGKLALAEVCPGRETADLVWCLTALTEGERRDRMAVYLYGDGTEVDLARLRRYFRGAQRWSDIRKGGR